MASPLGYNFLLFSASKVPCPQLPFSFLSSCLYAPVIGAFVLTNLRLETEFC